MGRKEIAKIRHSLGLLAVLMIAAACQIRSSSLSVPTPTTRVFESPATILDKFTSITIMDPDKPGEHALDYFGGSVALEGDRFAAGAPQWGMLPGYGNGAVYIYHLDAEGNWQPEAVLTASSRNGVTQVDSRFGEVIAFQGDLLVVGAPGYDDPWGGEDIGAVFIFQFNGSAWEETQILVPNRLAAGAQIGRGVALAGDTLAISGGPQSRNVYIYQRSPNGWEGVAEVAIPDISGSQPETFIDLFGDTLAISTVTQELVEAGEDEEAMVQSLRTMGHVTLFERAGNRWEQSFQTDALDVSLYRMYEGPFGIPVSLGGTGVQADLLAVGKPGFAGSGRETGTVALYARGEAGWSMQAEIALEASDLVPGAFPLFRDRRGGNGPDVGKVFFGAWVELDGERLGVISTFANTLYLFERQGEDWVYQYLVTPGKFGDTFQRRTVSLDGERLLLGSPGELGGGYVLIFEIAP